MPTPLPDLKTKTNRVRKHILDRFLLLADKVDQEKPLNLNEEVIYKDLLNIFAKNVMPRIQEITGEDGGDIKVQLTGINYIVPDGSNSQTNAKATSSVSSS